MSPRNLPLSLAISVLIPGISALAADRRGDNPDAPASTPQEQLAKFHVPPGFEAQLVAADPEIQKPINLNFDAGGRLWVTGSEMYPWPTKLDANGEPIADFDKTFTDITTAFRTGDKAPAPSDTARDTVRILSDFGPDGHARKIEVFADGLNIPSGVQPLPRKIGSKGDAAIVYSIPNIWRLEDTDGDGKADKREVLYGPFGFVDTHGGSSSYIYWIDGWIYGTHGFRNHSEVRDRKGQLTVLDSGNTYRFKPDGSALEIYTHGQTNPFGLAFDPFGNLYSADSHSKPVYMLSRGGYYEGIGKKNDGLGFAPRITDDDHGSSAIAGIAYYADNKYPAEYQGNLFNGNPVTQKINRDKLEWHGSAPTAVRQPDFLTCDDPWFRPVQVKLGPDGALYIADFYNPIIGHYEVPLTDPRRDHAHGRIWRVVWRGEKNDAPTVPMPNLATFGAEILDVKLGDSSLEVRRMATNELVDRIGFAASDLCVKAVKAGFYAMLARTPEQVTEHERLMKLGPASVTQSTPEERRAAHSLWVLERIEAFTEAHLSAALSMPGVGTHLLYKILADRNDEFELPSDFRDRLLGDAGDQERRAGAEVFANHPATGNIADCLNQLELESTASTRDPQLAYAWQIALRNQLLEKGAFAEFQKLMDERQAAPDAAAFTIVADVSLGMKTPQAALYLLSFLENTKLQAPRSGEYLKQAVLYLPDDKIDSSLNLIAQASSEAAPAQKLALATNLVDAARTRKLTLPENITAWSQGVILETLASDKDDLVKTAVASLRDSKAEAKLEPLAKIVRQTSRDGALRQSALEAAANLPASKELLTTTFADESHTILRKRAAELLTQNGYTDVVLAALPNAPEEIGITICGALAKTDTGAASLLDLVDAGKVSPRRLLNKAVDGPLTGRPKTLRDRAAALTKDLPPEDTRLNGVIANRTAAFNEAKPDTAHGAQIFQQTCAACHRFRNAGGNVGPNLDGVIARGPARLIEDILDPNRNVDPLFRQTTIETTDGETLLGANVRDQGGSLLLADATGKDFTVEKSRIKKQTVSPLSLMPPAFENMIPAADFNDLLGYLLSPAATP